MTLGRFLFLRQEEEVVVSLFRDGGHTLLPQRGVAGTMLDATLAG